jgi:hypothetical protein
VICYAHTILLGGASLPPLSLKTYFGQECKKP